jgi:hypothetical protein
MAQASSLGFRGAIKKMPKIKLSILLPQEWYNHEI